MERASQMESKNKDLPESVRFALNQINLKRSLLDKSFPDQPNLPYEKQNPFYKTQIGILNSRIVLLCLNNGLSLEDIP